jgi:hypothetical protein
MADPKLTSKFLILLGNGATPEVFAWPCGANARSVTFQNNTGETVVLDCTDPAGEVAAMQRWVESQDTNLSISGRLALDALPMWRAWFDDALTKNIRLVIDESAGNGGGFWLVPAILQTFEIVAEDKGTATFSATIVGAGRRSWTGAS